ncbi:MAG: hypothetical protein ACLR1T_13610 [Evtepia gabavorous]
MLGGRRAPIIGRICMDQTPGGRHSPPPPSSPGTRPF